MMSRLAKGFAGSAAAVGLCGCIAVGDVDRRGNTFNEEVGVTQNRSILLNLARASNEEPLYFLAFNQLYGGGTTDFRASAPQFFAGPTKVINAMPADKLATFSNTGTYLDNQTTSNFQMSQLATHDFYAGLMSPVNLNDVDLLLHQGYSRELIFYLVIDKATISVVGSKNPPNVVYNDPTSPTFDLFKYYIKEAMEHGLTTEILQNAAGTEGGEATTDASNKASVGTTAVLCYDKALAIKDDLPDIADASFCGAALEATAKDQAAAQGASAGAGLSVTLHDKTFIYHDQPLQIEVTTRSIYGMFYYLGRIIHSGQEIDLQPFNLPAETIPQAPLINVETGGAVSDHGGCFTAVGYEGKTFCVPLEGADNTKHIFGILNALLALKSSNADIPSTPVVRILQ
ncbi:MAG TPA: hypothetical protein VMU37_09210 [Caulobacteraceae bacterium]|nr:hypothetical protein [Caulobacteraceae bacterium]